MDDHTELAELYERLAAAGFDPDGVRETLVFGFLEDDLGIAQEDVDDILDGSFPQAPGDEGFYELAALNGVLAGLQLAGRSRTSGPAA